MIFQMRTTCPQNNKYYIRKASGGWNGAIQGKPVKSGANVLSNCVGYVNGRFNEIGAYNKCKYQLVCNPGDFISSAKSMGLKVSDKPTVGGVLVWTKGNTVKGHVAIVERVDNENQIYTSESSYGGTAFYNATRNNNNGRWGIGSAYIYRGCIINPSIKEIKPYTMYVNTSHDDLNVRDRAWGGVVGSLKRGTKVTVTGTDGEWSILSAPIKGYVYSEYLSNKQPVAVKNTVGQIKILKKTCHLYSRENLTGIEYTYLKDTKVKILRNESPTVDFVKVIKTGREAYINNKYFK